MPPTEPDPRVLPEWPGLRDPVRGTIRVAGADIAYARRPASDGGAGVPIVLVHGGSAHGAWWDPVLPALADRDTITLDLSGHGASAWRDAYAFDTWVAELTAVAEALSPSGRVLIGHSLGAAIVAAAVAGGLSAEAVVLVDSDGSGPRNAPPRLPIRPPRLFATRADAEAAVVRHKTSWPEGVARHVAARSVVAVDGGWRMHGDPAIRAVTLPVRDLRDLAPCPIHLVGGGTSWMRPQLQETARAARRWTHVTTAEVPHVGHDVMMEDPAAAVAAIRAAGGPLGG